MITAFLIGALLLDDSGAVKVFAVVALWHMYVHGGAAPDLSWVTP